MFIKSLLCAKPFTGVFTHIHPCFIIPSPWRSQLAHLTGTHCPGLHICRFFSEDTWRGQKAEEGSGVISSTLLEWHQVSTQKWSPEAGKESVQGENKPLFQKLCRFRLKELVKVKHHWGKLDISSQTVLVLLYQCAGQYRWH